MTEIDRLREQLRAFAEARDWEKFHSPKNLAMALARRKRANCSRSSNG